MRLNPRYKQGDVVFACEDGNSLYLVVVHEHLNGALVPITALREYVLNGRRNAHLVFAMNLHNALWTFTGFVEEPCHTSK